MADRTNANAPALMRPYVPPPSASAGLRAEMARTRQRLTSSLASVQELSSPSQLLATSARAVRHEAGRRLVGLVGNVLRRSVRSSPFGSGMALILAVVSRLVTRDTRTRRGFSAR